MLNFAFLFFQKTASLWGYLIKEKKHECHHNVKKLLLSTILLFSADCLLVEATDVLLFDGRDALTSFVILEYDKSRGVHRMFKAAAMTSLCRDW